MSTLNKGETQTQKTFQAVYLSCSSPAFGKFTDFVIHQVDFHADKPMFPSKNKPQLSQ